uniref:poly(A)-specific ribonuclease n=1 Tax=Romanomermis culicivorax TaxID=13658 RepID=A0A915K6R1_ROMCU
MVTSASANNASAANLTANSKLNEDCGIKEVYASNLYDEFDQMRRIVDKYCFIAMDTEFPGVVARPIGEFKSTADYQYQLLRCNVDLLKLIQ